MLIRQWLARDVAGLRLKTYPFCRVHVQVLDLAVLKETREPYSVVGEIWLLSEDSDGVFLCCGIVLEQLFSVVEKKKKV